MLKLKKGKYTHPSGKKNSLNDLSGSEWAQASKSVMSYEDVRSEKQRIHGAAFPQSLAEHHIICYTKKDEIVLDPFAGVGTTLDACKKTGRKGIGIEVNQYFVDLAKNDLSSIDNPQKLICDDVRNMLKHLKPNSIDFVITSPPYANMLHGVQKKFLYKWKKYGFKERENAKPYSIDSHDIGNLPYEQVLEQLKKVFQDLLIVTKNNCYAVWIVKDFRDLKNGKAYVNFHSDIISIATETGWMLWDIRIYDQTKFRPLVILGIPSRNYYLNIGHSYILIFKKNEKCL